jgi:hypothetical protein
MTKPFVLVEGNPPDKVQFSFEFEKPHYHITLTLFVKTIADPVALIYDSKEGLNLAPRRSRCRANEAAPTNQ